MGTRREIGHTLDSNELPSENDARYLVSAIEQSPCAVQGKEYREN